jgi:hypothetical protein
MRKKMMMNFSKTLNPNLKLKTRRSPKLLILFQKNLQIKHLSLRFKLGFLLKRKSPRVRKPME